MLDEMGKALLIIILMQCTCINPDADGNLPRRNVILFYRIAHTVGQHAKRPCVIDRDIAAFIQPGLLSRLAHLGRGRRSLRESGCREQQGRKSEGIGECAHVTPHKGRAA